MKVLRTLKHDKTNWRVILPQDLAWYAAISNGTPVTIKARKGSGCIVITGRPAQLPVRRRRRTKADRLADYLFMVD